MSPIVRSRIRLVFIAAMVLTACDSGPQDTNRQQGNIDAVRSTVEVSPATGVAADGTTLATITVTVRDPSGSPISGQEVRISATGTGTVIPRSLLISDRSGVAIGSIGSTVAQTKTIQVAVGLVGTAIPLQSEPTVEFVAGSAARLAFTAVPSQATAGSALTPGVEVSVQDRYGNLVATATAEVTLTVAANPAGGTLSGTATATTTGGVATFNDLQIDRAAAGYRLLARATAGDLSETTSAAIEVLPGAPQRLVVLAQPGNGVAGATLAPGVSIGFVDGFGNRVAAGSDVTVALGANPTGASVSGTTTVAAVDGVASFSDLVIERAGVGFDLVASSSGLTEVRTASFTVSPAASSQLSFVVIPTNARAGTAIVPAVRVSILDSFNNVVRTDTSTVTLSLQNNPSAATLGGNLTANAEEGVATFHGLSFDRSGSGFTLEATAPGLTSATSGAFDVAAGVPAQLAFSAQPSTTAATDPISPAIAVSVLDDQGNLVPEATSTVTLTLGSNSAGASLSGTTQVSAVGGVATFTDVRLDRAGTGFTLVASSVGLTGTTSSAFEVTAGPPTQMTLSVQPSDVTAGVAISPAVQVTLLDASGGVASGSNVAVTLSLGTNPGGGTLSGTVTVNAVAGVATFSDLSVDKVGSGYTLVASTTGVSSVTSSSFSVSAAAAAQLGFSVQPTTTRAGVAVDPAITVGVLDAFGNAVTGFDATVTLALGNNPGGATLSGTLSAATSNGVATFSNVTLDKAASGYTLVASAGGLTSATSASFEVTAADPTVLAFTAVPASGQAGEALSPSVAVAVQDVFGNTVTSSQATITVALGANPGSATLTGTLSKNASSGVAAFDDLRLDRPATGYTLTASASGFARITSATFDIAPGPPAQLSFGQEPGSGQAGVAQSPALTVIVKDSQGNTVTDSGAEITLSVASGPDGGAVVGTATVQAVSGIATFSDVRLERAGSYTLSAASSGLTSATSAAFDIAPGPKAKLGITAPATATAGTPFSPAVQVAVQDEFGNTVTSATDSITVALGANPAGGALLGTTTQSAFTGVASFGDLQIQKAGTGYTLVASAGGLTGAESGTFTVSAGAPAMLAFTTQPAGAVAGVNFAPAVQVSVADAFGNPVDSGTTTVTLALGANDAGGTLLGTTSVAAVSGVATFSAVRMEKAGTGYTLVASASGVSSGESQAFAITAADPKQLGFEVQPTNVIAGETISPKVRVAVRDEFGNLVSGATDSISLAIGNNPSGGVLLGTAQVAASGGVAEFTLGIDKAGQGYTLAATATDRTPVSSAAFNVVPGSPMKLGFAAQPTNVGAGEPIDPAVTVEIQDQFGNRVPSATPMVTVSLEPHGSGATLGGTKTVQAATGLATFSDLTLDKIGTGFVLRAASSPLAEATSSPFAVTPAPPSQLAFVVQPSQTTAGQAISPPVQVEVRDQFGNKVANATDSVTITIGTNPGSATLGGTATVNAVAGVATFSTLSLDKAASGYRLAAASGTLATATSALFNVIPATATKLAFGVQPSRTVAGEAIAPAVTVDIQDTFGNKVPVNGTSIGVTLSGGPGVLSGTVMATSANGTATFDNLRVDKVGSSYQLTAEGGGWTAANSGTFAVVPGDAANLVFIAQPGDAVAGATIAPPVQVQIQDGLGNPVPTATDSVSLTLVGADGATLSGTTIDMAEDGVAVFSDLSIDKAKVGYRLGAAATGLNGAMSDAFDVSPGAPVKLGFSVEPTQTTAGQPITPAVRVQVQDTLGNLVPTATDMISVALQGGDAGATLSGTTTHAASAGEVTFSGLSIDKTGTTYTLMASAASRTPATSATFTIIAGAPASMTFLVQPSDVTAGQPIAPAVEVQVLDGLGNRVLTASNSVTVGLIAGPAGTLSGTATRTPSMGVASFNDLSIDKAGAGYQLEARSDSLAAVPSATFTVNPGTASAVAIVSQPARGVSAVALSPAVVVHVVDGLGNRVLDATDEITLSLTTNPGGATLGGTRTKSAAAGIATFDDLTLDRSGNGYRLTAGSGSLTSGESGDIDIVAWQKVGAGLNGGEVQALAGHPSDAATAFAGTRFAGVFRTTDSGTSWTEMNDGLGSRNVRGFAVDTSRGGTLFVATAGGIYRSDDGGRWAAKNTGLSNTDVEAIALSADGTLYAGTHDGVFASSDSGDTWSARSTGLAGLVIDALAAVPGAAATLYAGTRTAGVYKTTDAGAQWTAVNTGIGETEVRALAVTPGSPAVVYAGTSGSLYRSDDAGLNWSAKTSGLSGVVSGIVARPGRVWAATNMGTFTSTNAGENWTAETTGLVDQQVLALAVDPTVDTSLLAATARVGVFRKTAATSWTIANSGITALPVNVVVGHPSVASLAYAGVESGAVYRSTNGGVSWTAARTGITQPSVTALVLAPSAPATLYAGTPAGVFRSSDGGDLWTAAGLAALGINALAVHPTTPGRVVAGVNPPGLPGFVCLRWSNDGGATWNAPSSGIPGVVAVRSLAFDATGANLYAGLDAAGVYVSSDNGDTWSAVNTGIASETIRGVIVNPSTATTIYAASQGGAVYVSTDSGSSWTQSLSAGVPVVDLDMSGDSPLFAATASAGARRLPGGGSWATINTGLETLGLRSIAVHPAATSLVFGGTSGDGLYRSLTGGL